MDTAALEHLKTKQQFFADCPPWCRVKWRTLPALDSFLKLNRAALVARGAVVKLGRDYFIIGNTFASVALELLTQPASHQNGPGQEIKPAPLVG